jgi:hypothetical protein
VGHNETDASEYEAQQKKLEGIVTPIISKLYASASNEMPGGMPEQQQQEQQSSSSSSSAGPNIEELD